MDRLENCPNCNSILTYGDGYDARVECENEHVFIWYKAHNGLVPTGGKPTVMHLPYSEAMGMFELGAQIWNSLVHYSETNKAKFWGRLLDIAIMLRDRARDGHDENYTTQMDYEVEQMKKDGHRPWSEREDGKSIRIKL